MSQQSPVSSSDSPVVHVIDDEPSICRLFERVCERLGIQTHTYSNAEAFLEQYDPAKPGCLILDLYLPTMNGLEVLEEISRRGWQIPIVIISGRAEVSSTIRAFKLGSIDFLEKPFTKEECENAVRTAIAIDARQRQEGAKIARIQQRMARLTPRENQVMDLVVSGKPNRIIAEDLGVSPKTVEVHRANVMQKMQASSLADLVKMVIAARAENHAEM